MSSVALAYPTRTIKIYASAYDGTARADIDEHVADLANPHLVTKAQVGLANADNTSDAAKPVSTATQSALALKAPLLSPALTGVPTAPTAPVGTVTVQLATTAFAYAAANDAIAQAAAAPGGDLALHVGNTSNPHGVTKAQVGLGAVDNTADIAKPVSNPTQAAINAAVAGVGAGTIADDLADHLADVANPHGVTKAQVGLGLVDNTADLSKPVSPAQQAAINAAAAIGTAAQADIDGHQANLSNPHATTKAQLGLGSVDNTADLTKPVSTAQQAAINVAAAAATAAQADIDGHQANLANPHAVTKAQVGLSAVDNTSDAAKPISTAQAAALALKAPLASPALTGVPTGPTAAPGTSTLQLATTAFVDATSDALTAEVRTTLDGIATAPERPGDAVHLYGTLATGAPSAVPPVNPGWVATTAAGQVVRVDSAVAADPELITTIGAFAIEAGFNYDVRFKVQRATNPVDPLNDSVTLGIRWLNNAKAGIGASGTALVNLPLVIADGVKEYTARIGRDVFPPGGTIYARPYVQLFGNAHITDVIVIELDRVCPAGFAIVTAMTASGTLAPGTTGVVFVSPAAPVTVTMPPAPIIGQTITIKDAIGASATHPITVDGGAFDIEAAPTLQIAFDYGWMQLTFSGTRWVQV